MTIDLDKLYEKYWLVGVAIVGAIAGGLFAYFVDLR